MNAAARIPLLEELKKLAHREAENADIRRTFLPLPMHRLALRQEIVVVRGGRGAGKSALFKLLKDVSDPAQLRKLFGDPEIPSAQWVDAFSETGLMHPTGAVLDELAQKNLSDNALRAFWMAHLVGRIHAALGNEYEVPAELASLQHGNESNPVAWIGWAASHVGALSSALDKFENKLALTKSTVFATYDHLDRIGTFDRETRSRYVSSLLALWLTLSNRYRFLRAKIFLRDDLFADGERSFPDASKLRPRSVPLEWDVQALYRVAIRHMAASPSLREWLTPLAKKGIGIDDVADFGPIPRGLSEDAQKHFADRLAGELMGSGVKKGYTYRWIPNRLQDAEGRIVPRSILCLIGFAAKHALSKPLPKGERLLSSPDLVNALPETSTARAGEIQEEYQTVTRLEQLRGLRVILPRSTVISRLAKQVEGEPSGLPTDGELVFDELRRLGVLRLREDGRIDVPDIYRYGFGILRAGGGARAK